MNRSLHCMAAHLHRYGSELECLAGTIEDIEWYNKEFDTDFVNAGIRSLHALGQFLRSFGEITAQMKAISSFRDEMQQKIDNILALVMSPSELDVTKQVLTPVARRQHTSHERSAVGPE